MEEIGCIDSALHYVDFEHSKASTYTKETGIAVLYS